MRGGRDGEKHSPGRGAERVRADLLRRLQLEQRMGAMERYGHPLQRYKDPKNVHQTEPLGADSIRSVIHTIGNAAGVDDCHPHRFRRTCATMALHRGMPLTLVQQMLGHDSLDTTQRYLDIQEDELREAHRRFVL